ncbi:MAG: Flagellin [bacterium ADurb.Bin236]|nr:MAG: Flagellin [bacterium ADurb.Bin236]HOY64069.1 flagellin [bacterium]HPN95570.1 flagellin [bacterium]
MISVNTNIYALTSQNYSRLNQLEFTEKTTRLSSGLKINYASDDPSGMAISSGMKAQMRGVSVAIGNAQDTQYLLDLTDHYVSDQWDVLYEMRNLTLKLANMAVNNVNPNTDPASVPSMSDCWSLTKEIEKLQDHVYRAFHNQLDPSAPIHTARFNFNLKTIFGDDSLGNGFETGQASQVGPNNSAANQIQIVIDNLAAEFVGFNTPYAPPPPFGDAGYNYYLGYADAMLDRVDGMMEKMNAVRVQVGILHERLDKTINDLNTQYINVSASNSRIEDADFANEIFEYTKNMIKQQGATMIASQANAQPLIAVPLLDAIYDGLEGQKMVGYSGVASDR